MADFKVIKDKQDQLVLAATDIAAIIVPYGTELGPVVDDATGELLEAPTGAQTPVFQFPPVTVKGISIGMTDKLENILLYRFVIYNFAMHSVFMIFIR